MKAKQLQSFLSKAFKAGQRVLIKGIPGIGKSDICRAAAAQAGMEFLVMHPAVSDPTDYKGMPSVLQSKDGSTTAEFLPFGDLRRLITTEVPLVCLVDDIGQASVAVQAALMQLIQARAVNGHRISDKVVFVGATNDNRHLAGVTGLIEPVKSRFDTIIELEATVDDWCEWALANNMPPELIAYVRFAPGDLSDFKPTKELKNSPCPRTMAAVGRWMNCGVRDYEVFAGAVGEGVAAKLIAFLDLIGELPSIDQILMDPDNAPIPDKAGQLYAVSAGLANRMSKDNADRAFRYLGRLQKEYEVYGVRDAVRRDKAIASTRAFVAWAAKNASVLA